MWFFSPIFFRHFLFPKLLRSIIKSVCKMSNFQFLVRIEIQSFDLKYFETSQQINVATGSKLRPMYVKTPIFLNFKVYIFNVTNSEEVSEGSEYNFIKNNLESEIQDNFYLYFFRKTKTPRGRTILFRVRTPIRHTCRLFYSIEFHILIFFFIFLENGKRNSI